MSSQPSQGLQSAKDAVLVKSVEVDHNLPPVKGYDFNNGIKYEEIVKAMFTTGYQATHVARAVKIINDMLDQYERHLQFLHLVR